MGKWALLFAALLVGTMGQAAEINKTGDDAKAMIFVTGELRRNDSTRFTELALQNRSAMVVLASPGGSLSAGIEIGETVRLLDMRTMVPGTAICASACALAWLGGTRRIMNDGAQIGFHAAYRLEQSGQASVSSMGNALVGGYLNKLGLSDQAIFYITRSDPGAMQWLTQQDALQLGISLQTALRSAKQTGNSAPALGTPPRPTPTPPPPKVTWRVKAGVSKGYQNIRTGPGTMHAVKFRIPARQGNITVGKCRRPDPGGGRYDWCQVTWRGQSGWSSINGLEQDVGL